MVTRRPSSSQFKKTSRQMRSATIKSHLPGRPSPIAPRKGFSDARRARTAARGEIHQVLPDTTTRESLRMYESRMSQRAFMERSVASSRRRKAALAAVLAVLIAAAACVAGAFVYVGGIDSRLAVQDDAALDAALSAPAEGQTAVYTLFVAGYDASPAELVALVRTDASTGAATVLAVSGDVSMRSADGAAVTLAETYASGGDAALVKAFADAAGVGIAHYARTDAAGIVGLVDALGGVDVTLETDVSDPDAGSMTLVAGSQTLSGEQALFLCRANDFDDAQAGRARNVALVAAGVYDKLSSMDGIGFYLSMDKLSNFVKTDMDVRQVRGFLSDLRSIQPASVASAAVPTVESSEGGAARIVDAEAFASMVTRVGEGLAPVEDVGDIVASIDAASVSVTVNNGGDVVGAASAAEGLLTSEGFNVESVGNANMQVYDETLVIYKDSELAEEAEAICAVLGHGRALQDSVHYVFDTDVLVMVGKDWEPGVQDGGEDGV